MSNYYYISDSVYKAFPDLRVSKPIKRNSHGGIGYVAVIPDFSIIESLFEEMKDTDGFTGFAYECVNSQLQLSYIKIVDYDEDDKEVEESRVLSLDDFTDDNLIEVLEETLSISKEQNIAYAIFRLAESNSITPIEVINK